MLIIEPVLETVDTADFRCWPVAGLAPYGFLALSARMTPLKVGSALAALSETNAAACGVERAGLDAEERIRLLLDTEKLIASGGLRVRCTETGITVNPGCCCGLEDWREWADLPNGGTPWLGHSPSPRIERADRVLRLWPDGGDSPMTPAGPAVEIGMESLPGILRSVQQALREFVGSAERWADRHVPSLGAELAAKLDQGLTVSGPLPDDGH